MFALVASPALASRPPAINIYVEQVPTASGPKSLGSGATTPSQSVPLSQTAAANLQRDGGKDRKVLETVATSREFGAQGSRVAAGASPARTPSPISAAFGIGSGPATLFVVLIVGALFGFAVGRLRGRRS